MNKLAYLKKLILPMLFLSSSCLYGQSASINGVLTGTVIDMKTNQPLPGANILILGTMIGASSDLQGNFIIRRIPPGRYQVKVTMMGYKSKEVNVQIEAQTIFEINFRLEETVIETPGLVVTAGKKAQSFQDVPNSVSLISAREIQRKEFTNLDEVLEYTPGLTVTKSDVNIRGSTGYSMGAGSRVLLLVDGIPMMPGDSGDIKWDIVPLSQIERVEVVKGAGSALYGSHAIGGVINIISKDISSTPLTDVKFSSGIYDNPPHKEWDWTDRILHFNQLDISHSRKWKNIGILISGGRRESTGYQQNGHYQRYNLLGKLNIKFDPQKQITIQSNWATDDHGEIFMWRNPNAPLEMPLPAVGDELVSDKFSFNSAYRHLVNQKFAYKFRTSLYRNSWQYDRHDSDEKSKAYKIGLELQGDYMPSPEHSFTFGVEGIYDQTESDIFFNHHSSTWAAYIQDDVRISKYISATLGLRFDYHKVDIGTKDNQWNPKIGFTIKPSLLTTIRTSVGRGFRSPTLAELFTQTSASGLFVVPNPDLVAEKAWSYEVGINQILGEFLLLDIAAFLNDYSNFIEPERDEQRNVRFINLNRARTKGIECTAQTRFWKKRISSTLGYTFLEPEDRITGETLAYRPKQYFSGSLNLSLKNFETGIDYRYIGRMDVVKVYPDEDRVAQKVWDYHTSCHYKSFSFSFTINNMFNYSYVQVERNMAPIRNYSFAISTQF